MLKAANMYKLCCLWYEADPNHPYRKYQVGVNERGLGLYYDSFWYVPHNWELAFPNKVH